MGRVSYEKNIDAFLTIHIPGTPVAAFPVDGPLKVAGLSDSSQRGGVMHADLQTACYEALAVPRHEL